MKNFNSFFYAYWRSIFIASVIFVLTTFTISDLIVSPEFPLIGRDKIDHFVVFYIFSSFLIVDLQLNTRFSLWQTILLVFVICMTVGGTTELIQHWLLPLREGSLFDMLANMLGCVSACFIQPVFKLLRY
jgi:VanZ family protein